MSWGNGWEWMTTAQVVEICRLADWKLTGDDRTATRRQAVRRRMTKRQAEAIIARLTAMPDRSDGHANAKLRPEQVQDIRARRKRGETLQAIADHYKVATGAVSRICAGKTWTHLPDPPEEP